MTDPSESAAAAASAAAPLCAPPDPDPRPPGRPLPAGACDCHAHICGPAADFAYDPARIYTPPDALLPAYRGMLETLGLARAVLVQPSVYGTDNRVLLGALAEMGAAARGVAVVANDIEDTELDRLHDAGVRGVRLNLVDIKDPGGPLPLADARALAERIGRLGWHVEFLVHVDDVPDLDRQFADFPVDVVFGHLGYVRPGQTPNIDGFQALLRLLEGGGAWVKLTGPYRITQEALPYGDTDPFARALFAAAPERLIWGSDWPHVMVKSAMPNDGALCDILRHWAGDEAALERVLVGNPETLYGFN